MTLDEALLELGKKHQQEMQELLKDAPDLPTGSIPYIVPPWKGKERRELSLKHYEEFVAVLKQYEDKKS